MYRSMTSSKQQPPAADRRDGVAWRAEKRKYSDVRSSSASAPNDAHQRRRILSRKYPLIKTGYKYLELGIGVPMSMTAPTVEIAIGDTHGKELLLSPAMWTTLLRNRPLITSYLQERGDAPAQIEENGFTVAFSRINDARIVRLETAGCRLPLSAQTMRTFYTLRHCVECIIASLHGALDRTTDRLSRYAALASNGKENASLELAVVESGDFDAADIVDCELLALVFDTAP